MVMSADTRRRVVLFVVALIVVAMVLASTGCSATSGEGGDEGTSQPLDAAFYPGAVSDICAETDGQLAELPAPGEGVSEADWAFEVSRILDSEAVALSAVGTIGSVRDDHRAFIANTETQAAAWSALSTAIAAADAEGVDTARTEILELSGGRIELAAELGIGGCRERSL